MVVTGAEQAMIVRFAGGLETAKAMSAGELVLATVCGNTKLHGKGARQPSRVPNTSQRRRSPALDPMPPR